MTTHSEQKFVPFTPDQLFEMVSDVQSYPKFLPWCVGARIRSADDELIVADLMIGYKLLRERFTSRVTLDRAKWKIETEFTDGPFKFLRNQSCRFLTIAMIWVSFIKLFFWYPVV